MNLPTPLNPPKSILLLKGWACLNIRWHIWHMKSMVTSLLLYIYNRGEGEIRSQSSVILQRNDLWLLLSFYASALLEDRGKGKGSDNKTGWFIGENTERSEGNQNEDLEISGRKNSSSIFYFFFLSLRSGFPVKRRRDGADLERFSKHVVGRT